MVIKQIEDGNVSTLTIELTRKCNFSCGHCLRGDAQSKNFDVKHLRKFIIDNCVDQINELVLTGGEPLLVPDIIREIVQEIQWRGINIGHYYIATNGSVFNEDSLDAILKLHNVCYDQDMSYIEVSNSIWHKEDKNYVGAMDLDDIQRKIGNEAIDRLPFGCYFSSLEIGERRELGYGDRILAVGRAKDFGSEAEYDMQPNMTYLNVNGDIILDCCDASYENQEDMKVQINL